MRHLSMLDQLLVKFDQGLKILTSRSLANSTRPYPASMETSVLSDEDRRHSASLMRVNHTGEVCAQALYQGQALTAYSSEIKARMAQAAQEEVDHLAWCEKRLIDLKSHVSYFNPFWYAGSFVMGAFAGLIGDKWSLGFVAETERQVVEHLDKHLDQLSFADQSSRVIITQMREDELHHATVANEAGAAPLPLPVKLVMRGLSKVMTTVTYWI